MSATIHVNDEMLRKARFVFDSLQERRIIGAETLTNYAIDIAAMILTQSQNGSSCTGDPCTCANGIGCVNIPVDQW